jgi:hypothetical protein
MRINRFISATQFKMGLWFIDIATLANSRNHLSTTDYSATFNQKLAIVRICSHPSSVMPNQ